MGLQSAIVTSCNWQPCPGGIVPCPDILACNAGASPGDTMVLMASGLTIGQTYWLLVDGSNGANCLYTINYISGTFAPQIDEDITTGYAVPNIVCQGLDKFTMNAAPAIPNAHGYLWNLGWNDQVVTSTLPTDTIEIENNAPPGIWDICVQAFSGCDTSDIPFCFTVEIIELNDIEKAPETFCSEEFPFDWYGTNITGPGTYDHSFNNPVGCPYDSIWTIESEPEPLVNFNYTVNDLQIQFENLSTTANEFSWNFGDGVSSSQINPTHTYSKPGSFLIELIGLSGCGSDTINKIVVLKSNSNETILITPNGDNVNDILVINGIEAFPKNELTIVNRWGDVVYKAQPYMNDWGGEGKDGSLLTQGIYYFILKHVGAQLPQSGDIVILK